MTDTRIVDELRAAFPGLTASEFRGQTRVVAPVDSVFALLERLKDEFGFDLLVDVTCVDYLDYAQAEDRFGLVYLLANTETADRIAVRCFVGDRSPVVPSIVAIWEGANWLEREVWDMFGIRFDGHPDLRRILLPEQFAAHPLRKDYPLQGLGERHNFPVISRADG